VLAVSGLGYRYAMRDPLRFALTAGGLACAVVLTVFLAGVYRGAVRGSLSYVEDVDAQIWVGRRGSWNLMRSSGLLTRWKRDSVLAVPGVTSAEPILAALLPATVGGTRRTLLVIGLDPDADAARPRRVRAGAGVPDSGGIVVDEAFARRMGLAIGDTFDLAEHTARVVGITGGTNLLVTQYAFVSRSELLDAIGVTDRSTFLLVRADPSDAVEVARAIEASVGAVTAFPRDTFIANNRREIEAGFLPVLWAIALLGIVVGGAVVAVMTYAAVLEKRADYVLLAALGAAPRVQVHVVLQQAVLAAGVGSVVGLGVLVLLQRLLPAVVPELPLMLDPVVALMAVAGAVGMAALGAAVPGRLAARLPPLEALRR
jgi:putative ABC transport system permease protein